ncbi:MAG: amino acid adenylation domain-containing protein [Acidimicrobiia bacterium]
MTDLVAHWVARTPEHPAVIDVDGSVITYADLWRASGELSRQLPIVVGEVVGISMSRGAGVVIAMLAALRAGGVYCPTSPTDPRARTRLLQDRVGIRFVVHEDSAGAPTVEDRGGRGRVLDGDGDGDSGDRPIYVMWTSGSTGEPKAVVVAHCGVVRLVRDTSLMDLRTDDRVAFASNPMFDAATWEVWATLGNGATIVVIDQDDLLDAVRLRHRFEIAGVTRAFLTTSLFDMHVSRDPSMFGGLRTLAVGGEPLRPRTIGAVLASDTPPGELVNGYGPTECTTFATSHRIALGDVDGARIPIGTPLLDARVMIVDGDGRAVPAGEEGELWLAGRGVALGYLGPDGLEQDRFLEAVFDDDEVRRWYRTGDLVRLDERGAIDLLGRLDRQVKIRGYRIEPIEIEQAIASCDGVVEVAVVADRSSEIVRLCAFVVGNSSDADERASLVEQIRSHLRIQLPIYMHPARITVVDRLPLTVNGKLDVAALLDRQPTAPPPDATSSDATRYTDPLLTAVVDQARLVLADPILGPGDDLWEAGLDSLAAIELATALSEVLGRTIHPTKFLDHPTPAAIVAQDRSRHPRPSNGITVFDPSSAAEPIFAVLGRGTTPLVFRHVAQHLTGIGRQLIVIESGEFRPHVQGRDRIEAIAAAVAVEVESRRPDGVVLLAGWSAGGVIATHAAWLLEQRGRAVRLMLFDTIFFTRQRGERGATVMAGFRHVARRLRDALGRHTDADDHDSHRIAQATQFTRQLRELRAYGAPPPLDAPVANLHVNGSAAESIVATTFPGSTAIEVGGNHNSMFDSSNAEALVRRLDQWLATTSGNEPRDRSGSDGFDGSDGSEDSDGSAFSGARRPRR